MAQAAETRQDCHMKFNLKYALSGGVLALAFGISAGAKTKFVDIEGDIGAAVILAVIAFVVVGFIGPPLARFRATLARRVSRLLGRSPRRPWL